METKKMGKIKKITRENFISLCQSERVTYINAMSNIYAKCNYIERRTDNNAVSFYDIDSDTRIDCLLDYADMLNNEATDLQDKLFLKDFFAKIKTKKDHEATITDNERKKLEKKLNEVQKRSSVRTIEVNNILFEIKLLEKRLNEYMTLADMIEVKCDIDSNSQEFSSGYKYTPYSTFFTVKCLKPHFWIVTNIRRDVCYEISRKLTLSDQQKEKILNAEIMKIEKKVRK